MQSGNNTFQFHWISPLGISVILFLIINFIYFILGILTPFIYRFFSPELTKQFGLIFSPRSDSKAFGRPTLEIIKDHPEIMHTKLVTYDVYFGLYLAIAVLHFCLTWYGLKQGHSWALWALTFANLAVIMTFLLAVRDFSVNLAILHWNDIPPYATIPGIILPFAIILGWIGLYK